MGTINRLRGLALGAAAQRALKHTDRSRGIYPALSELAGRYRGVSDPPNLTAYELRVFSQNGEDGVLAEILRRIGVAGGTFVEFGVQDGSEGTTVFLAQVLGWSGAYLEADPAAYAALERRFSASPRVRTLQAAAEPDNVEALFERAGVPDEPDVVSIDVDGNDYWIWRALERYRPRVVVIEYNGDLDPASHRVMPYAPGFRWDHSSGYGASLAALEALGEEKGYVLVHTESAGVNAFFVRSDLARGLPSGQEVPRRSANHALMGLGHPAPRREPDWQ
ncbi:MAG: hypothetical protein ACRDPC_18615 [Solirubrobacteraceae bacterium]